MSATDPTNIPDPGAPQGPADRPSTDALLGALRGLRYENDGHDRPIITPEAMDALPVGSVVLDCEGDVWRRMDDGVWLPLSAPDWPTPPLAAFLPATALSPDRPSAHDAQDRAVLRPPRPPGRCPMTPAPTPQPPDHGAAGFCTDHGQAADRPTTTPEALDALRERVAAALYDGNEAFHAALAHERGQEYQRISRPSWVDTHEYYRALYLARADAALAVVAADTEGIAQAKAEALREAADVWVHLGGRESGADLLRDRADRIDPEEPR